MNELQTASDIAKQLADPLRLAILQFLTWGPCSVAKLVETTGASQPNVSNHLKLMRESGVVVAEKRGRQTFYRVASPEIAEVIAALSWAAGKSVPASCSTPTSPPETPMDLREARTCYDHLAGRLGVGLMAGLIQAGAITQPAGAWGAIELGLKARQVFKRLGLDLDRAVKDGTRRRFAFACPDWSEHDHSHLGGLLGAVLCDHCTARGWIEREAESRAMTVTDKGRKALDWLS